jgi:diphthamide biosynthesis methyltransferase
MEDIFTLTHKARELVTACESLYWEKWSAMKQNIIENTLEPHHKQFKTVNLLSSAIRICEKEEDARVRLVILGSALSPSQ